MISINLNDLRFYSLHGVHTEEGILGSEYKVDVRISFESIERIDSLEQTIDYVKAYKIVASCMERRYNLLETLAMDMCNALHDGSGKIKKINITILKMNPPLSNFKGNVAISFCKEY